MRTTTALTAVLGTVCALALLIPRTSNAGGDPVAILVLRESGAGSTAQAQPFVDKLVGILAKLNGWPRATGKYENRRTRAEEFIRQKAPHYAILSLPAFLDFRARYRVEVVGQVDVERAGGRRYHLVSKSLPSLDGCKGKRLASDHGDDPKFIERVASGGQFKLSDFQLVATRRPLQTLQKVVDGEADCALIDDAQLAELGKLEGTRQIRTVWSGAKLPPMPVVAFPAAPARECEVLQQHLAGVCEGAGRDICAEVGMRSLRAAGPGDYAAIADAYGR
jgi:hypothetical protein